jgi:iron complex outermembrane receptor protein
MKFKTLGVASSLAIIAGLATPAFAQDETGAPQEQQEGRSNEIVVTAQFREQVLQDVPIAITAVNAEMIEARGQTDVAQVAAQAPNVTLKPQDQGGGAGLIAYIRGVGQTDFIYARDPGVGVYIDDVYIPTLQSSLIELMDLDRIEVLRGPQGTLAGKNSIGGAIKLFGQRPRGDGSGSLEVSYGSYNDLRVRGMADFALTDDLAIRISGMSRNTDGYVDVVDYGLTHPTSNVGGNQSIGQFPQLTEVGGRHVTAGRVALEWEPTDRLNVYVTADYTNQDGDPGASVLIAAGAPGVPFDPTTQNPATSVWGSPAPVNVVPWLVGTDGNAVTVGCQFVPAGPHSCDTPPAGYDPRFLNYANYLDASAPTPQAPYKPYYAVPKNTFEGWGVHGTLTFDVNDNLQAVWISSYRKYESTWAFDQDLTPVPIAQLNNINRHWAWSQELRLNFELADGLIEGTVGGFYFDQYGEYEARVDLNYVNPTIDFIHGPDETPSESKAVFANVTLRPTDALGLTGGIRYSDESKDYVYYRRNPDYTVPDAAECFAPGGAGLFASPNCLLVGFLGTEGNFADTRIDWRVVADYRFSDQFLAYASVSTGFKGGGVNPRPFVPDQALPFNPETLTTYEAGFKADVLDRRVRLNGAGFFNKYKDIQGTQLVCPESSLPFPCLRPANVGSADMWGLELETQVYPVEGLSIDGSIAYINFEYTSEVDPATGTLVNTSIPADAVTPYTPELTYAFGIQYEHGLGSGSTITARFDGSYQSEIFTTSENTPFSKVDSYFLGNGRLTFTSPDESWKFWVEVQNIFDKYYFLTISDASNSLGIVSGAPGLPRTWSVGVRRRF